MSKAGLGKCVFSHMWGLWFLNSQTTTVAYDIKQCNRRHLVIHKLLKSCLKEHVGNAINLDIPGVYFFKFFFVMGSYHCLHQ